MIQVDISNVWGTLSLPDLLSIEKEVFDAHTMLAEGTGKAEEFRGWMGLPARETPEETQRILKAAGTIRASSDVCVVVGTDGSCLGPRAAIELLQGLNRNLNRGKTDPRIFFAGNNLSTRSWNELAELLEEKDFSVIVVSSSGTELEPAIAFRSLRWMLERRYGTDEAKRRIYAVTDPEDGALRQMAREENWEIFEMPAGISGGHAALSAAGLLPMAVAGIDVTAVLRGAADAKESYDLRSFENPAWLYAGVRNALYRKGRMIEVFASFEPGFRGVGHWWQQLFGLPESKDGQGIFPAIAQLPGDLYLVGQNGRGNLFETMVRFNAPEKSHIIGSEWKGLDGLNYLEGKTLGFVEEMAFEAVVTTHEESGIPVLVLDCGELSDRTVGELFYFLELCCCIDACMLGANPVDRPGLEEYERNLFRLLGKPGCND